MPDPAELKQTLFLALALDEASAKVSTGFAEDPAPDYDLPVWAGILPISQTYGEPQPDPVLRGDIATPGYVTDYRRPSAT
jgi:hypothetical protein